MNKYFVVSDIHSFYFEFKQALWQAGFRKTNKEHILIICGDVFDRGPCSVELYQFIKSLPKKRVVLVRGNHESLYFDLLFKKWPDSYDFDNGTVATFCQIAEVPIEKLSPSYYYKNNIAEGYRNRMSHLWNNTIIPAVRSSEITAWLYSKDWLDYYELDRFIFVHSFIPVKNLDCLPGYYIRNRTFAEMPDWRTKATDQEWEDARWGCPWRQYLAGLFANEIKAGKCLVCGHWHVSDFHRYLDGNKAASNTIYYSDNLIGLDCGCHISYSSTGKLYEHPQNVLVIDNGICYDQFGERLYSYNERQAQESEESSEDPNYYLKPDTIMYDTCYCASDCTRECGRKQVPVGIHTASDFSAHCTSYKKPTNNNK